MAKKKNKSQNNGDSPEIQVPAASAPLPTSTTSTKSKSKDTKPTQQPSTSALIICRNKYVNCLQYQSPIIQLCADVMAVLQMPCLNS